MAPYRSVSGPFPGVFRLTVGTVVSGELPDGAGHDHDPCHPLLLGRRALRLPRSTIERVTLAVRGVVAAGTMLLRPPDARPGGTTLLLAAGRTVFGPKSLRQGCPVGSGPAGGRTVCAPGASGESRAPCCALVISSPEAQRPDDGQACWGAEHDLANVGAPGVVYANQYVRLGPLHPASGQGRSVPRRDQRRPKATALPPPSLAAPPPGADKQLRYAMCQKETFAD